MLQFFVIDVDRVSETMVAGLTKGEEVGDAERANCTMPMRIMLERAVRLALTTVKKIEKLQGYSFLSSERS